MFGSSARIEQRAPFGVAGFRAGKIRRNRQSRSLRLASSRRATIESGAARLRESAVHRAGRGVGHDLPEWECHRSAVWYEEQNCPDSGTPAGPFATGKEPFLHISDCGASQTSPRNRPTRRARALTRRTRSRDVPRGSVVAFVSAALITSVWERLMSLGGDVSMRGSEDRILVTFLSPPDLRDPPGPFLAALVRCIAAGGALWRWRHGRAVDPHRCGKRRRARTAGGHAVLVPGLHNQAHDGLCRARCGERGPHLAQHADHRVAARRSAWRRRKWVSRRARR